MKRNLFAGASLLFLSSVFLSSCTTNSFDKLTAEISPQEKANSLKSGVKIDNDIKSILSAGGLDVSNPSASGTTGTQMASVKSDKAPPQNNEVASLVATLSPAPQTSPHVASAGEKVNVGEIDKSLVVMKETSPVKADAPANSKAPMAPALALVESKPTVDEQTYHFPDIGPPSATRQLLPSQLCRLSALTLLFWALAPRLPRRNLRMWVTR